MGAETPRVVQGKHVSVRGAGGIGCSLMGRRWRQEDAIGHSDLVWAIADGAGGHADGDLAARTAVDALCRSVTSPVDRPGLADAIAASDAAVRALAGDTLFQTPAATLVAVAVQHRGLGVVGAWVGDARAYLVGDGTLTLLTTEHPGAHGRGAAALGAPGDRPLAPGTFEVAAGHGAHVLLCSDGLFDAISEDEAAAALPSGLRELTEWAALTGRDNVTTVLVDVDAFTERWSLRMVGPR